MPASLIGPVSLAELLLTRRLRDGITQREAAEHYGVSVDQYRDWETGVTEKDAPRIRPFPLTVAESCRILRRRSGKTQYEISLQVGVSLLWVVKMERGVAPVGRLASYWGLE